jgi:hypothetical protein
MCRFGAQPMNDCAAAQIARVDAAIAQPIPSVFIPEWLFGSMN